MGSSRHNKKKGRSIPRRWVLMDESYRQGSSLGGNIVNSGTQKVHSVTQQHLSVSKCDSINNVYRRFKS